MKLAAGVSLFSLIIIGLHSSNTWAETSASADLINAGGKKLGTVTLTQLPGKAGGQGGGVKFSLNASNLTPGTHAIHIHEKGLCQIPDFKTAGGHFNPFHKEHGHGNPKGSHAGDLPNIEVKSDGVVAKEWVDPGVTLASGPNSLMGTDGTSIVIHAQADDGKSNPAGNAGDRVACGVIRKK